MIAVMMEQEPMKAFLVAVLNKLTDQVIELNVLADHPDTARVDALHYAFREWGWRSSRALRVGLA